MKPYFQMESEQKRRYQLMVARAIQDQWEKAVLYQSFEGSYEKWLNKYLQQLEDQDKFEQLQAFIDYHTSDDDIRTRKL